MQNVAQLSDQIAMIDNNLLGASGVGATYVLRGDAVAIVETGTSHSAPFVLAGLRQLGIDPAEVRHIVLTHVHMDHAGGTGTLVKAMPEAQVHIHSRTARFLVAPADLIASAQRALGALFPLHGPVEPVPAERIVAADELRLDLGRGVLLEAVATPGHSPDHLAYYEAGSGALLLGDAIGISVPAGAYLGPVTPPPAFNVAAQRATYERLLALEIDTLLFTHFGPSPERPRAMIEQQRERFEQLLALVEAGWRAGHVDHAAIIRQMFGRAEVDTYTAELMVGWIEMSINGLELFLKRQEQKAQEQAGDAAR